MEFLISGEDELDQVVEHVVPLLENTPLVLLRGDLGAGKTTLVKRIAKQLGVQSDMSSPSFGLVNEYQGQNDVVYHIDLYRINDASEVFEFGLPEVLDSGNACFVEWPEMAEEIWQEYEHLTIKITMDERESRRIFVE
ncbi:MAG: tRNA (adenosine(37)-N6)-threonylcarbamoyltransferase complex ATPase subunit type 1 TsaE [Bacteroidia bacterium]|nr:tRNA (adenosine(37)-N6)-threonylcarbamoyltransferase complex ATPase subunit type 1 TsaE [Bacteroidia bacterium]